MILLNEIICIIGFIITIIFWIRDFEKEKNFQETLYHFPFMIIFVVVFFALWLY